MIIGFPSNDFLNQEPGNNMEIKSFCSINYGVTFPMMQKIIVKGKEKHPVYSWLTNKFENGEFDSKVKWNFRKYRIDEKGDLVFFAKTSVKLFSDEIVNWIGN